MTASTFPTPAPSTTPRLAEPILSEPPADVSPWDLTPDVYERWEERVCIMHYDGGLPWREAETLALVDVLRQADPPVGKVSVDAQASAGPAPEIGNADEPAGIVQPGLFAAEKGPYR